MKKGIINSIKELNNYCKKTGKAIILTKDGYVKGFRGKDYSYKDYQKHKKTKKRKKKDPFRIKW